MHCTFDLLFTVLPALCLQLLILTSFLPEQDDEKWRDIWQTGTGAIYLVHLYLQEDYIITTL